MYSRVQGNAPAESPPGFEASTWCTETQPYSKAWAQPAR